MSREIKCTVCRRHMGEIRDAKLRKGTRFICEPCDMRRLDAMVELHKRKTEPENPIEKILGKGFMGS